MLRLIPTYVVKFYTPLKADSGSQMGVVLRVSETDLESVLRVLKFNGAESFSVELERP